MGNVKLEDNLLRKWLIEALKADNVQSIKNMFDLNLPIKEICMPNTETSILLYYSAKSSPRIFKFLIENRIHFDCPFKELQSLPAFVGVSQGNVDNVQVVLDSGIDVNTRNHENTTLLHYSIIFNHIPVVKLLLERGARTDIRSIKHGYPLHYAITNDKPVIVEMLLKSGCDTELRDSNEMTSLLLASFLGRIECVRLLLDYNAKTETFTAHGFNFLHIAILKNHLTLVQFLFSRGESILRSDGRPWHCLHETILQNNREMLKFLLRNGANLYEEMTEASYNLIVEKIPSLESKIGTDESIGMTAIFRGELELLRIILESGFNPNHRMAKGLTPLLHFACFFQNFEMAKLLVEYGADTRAINSKGNCAFELLKDKGRVHELQNTDKYL